MDDVILDWFAFSVGDVSVSVTITRKIDFVESKLRRKLGAKKDRLPVKCEARKTDIQHEHYIVKCLLIRSTSLEFFRTCGSVYSCGWYSSNVTVHDTLSSGTEKRYSGGAPSGTGYALSRDF